jgi:hypothetical protein
VSIYQNGVKPLQAFCDGVRQWMDEILVSAGPGDQWRSHTLKQWDKVFAALDEIFYFELGEDRQRESLTDLLMGVDGVVSKKHRIPVTDSVRKTLIRWASGSVGKKKDRKS